MNQHPQQHTPTGGTRTVTVTATLPVASAPVFTISPAAALAAQRFADLMAATRANAPTQLVGIVSGQGNQGSSNQAHLAGHAGTGASAISLPRQLKVGQSGTKPQ